MVRSVQITTIPHSEQAYDTLGDWRVSPNGEHVIVKTTELGDWRESMVCAVHELVEALLCVNDGVAEEDVSHFDMLYEDLRTALYTSKRSRVTRIKHTDKARSALRKEFGCDCSPTEDSEPGEDRHAPYRKQHAFADGIERLLANELGIVWADYGDKVAELEWNPK